MKADDFSFLAQLVRRRSGLVLRSNKAHLIEGRLNTVLRRFGFRTVSALIHELRHGRDTLARAVTEAMTTNESSFFRDRSAFDKFRDVVLPQLLTRRADSKRLRIWSAACAAGQEPYSIAMLLDDEKLLAKGWTIDLIATDLSSEIIARAEAGVYSHYEVQRGLAIRKLVAHFTQEGGNWRIHENLRRMVSFRAFNLLDSFGWLDDLDVVFCRNVLLYFDQKTKASILEKIAETLTPDGVLVLGHTETADALGGTFVPIPDAPHQYRHVNAPQQRLAVAG
jgi:chemotaxis protein methyltransferase CheR